ncbi:MAG: hypothetical protein H0V66_06285 [Bdellovibrionales bacterium]|nr:hypothetical protein [Bdellovibrionales bacterium]
MKTLLPFLFLINSAYSSPVKPERGLYVCKVGNDESICDQILKPVFKGEKLSTISVEYVGWCGSMGPYSYACHDNVCEDPGLRFEFQDAIHYRWENKQHGFHCKFEKK